METQKPKFAETLLEVLRENQKTLNHVIMLSGNSVPESNGYQKEYATQSQIESNGHSGVSIQEVLEKMSELIELNKVTLQTIDLLDKRIKRLHFAIESKSESQNQSTEESLPEEHAEEYVEG